MEKKYQNLNLKFLKHLKINKTILELIVIKGGIIIYIREDLEKEIKSRFKLKKLSYIGIAKDMLNDTLFIFETDTDKKFAIEIGMDNNYYGYMVVNSEFYDNTYLRKDSKIVVFYYYEGKTIVGTKELEGKAFNFDAELVALKLEEV